MRPAEPIPAQGFKCQGGLRALVETIRARRRAHLHGLAAGSLLVLALFVATAVPAALWALLQGDVSWTRGFVLVAFSLLLGGSIREARAWQRWQANNAHPA